MREERSWEGRETKEREGGSSEPNKMPRLTAGRGGGREQRKKQRQERRREGRGGDPKDEPDNMPRRIQRGEKKK